MPCLSLAQENQEEVFYGIDVIPRGGDQDWGIGVYHVPYEKKLPIYNKNSSELAGYLTQTTHTMLFDQNGTKLEQIYQHGIVYIGVYELAFIQVEKHPRFKDFYLINWKSADHTYAINKSDLAKIGAEFYTYRELLTSEYLPNEIKNTRDKSWVSIGINASKTCLNLRELPSVDGEKIDCIRGNDWGNETQTRLKILEVSDNWAKLDVQLLILDQATIDRGDFGDSYPYKMNKKLTGWVKFIDDDGFPNLWFSVSK